MLVATINLILKVHVHLKGSAVAKLNFGEFITEKCFPLCLLLMKNSLLIIRIKYGLLK